MSDASRGHRLVLGNSPLQRSRHQCLERVVHVALAAIGLGLLALVLWRDRGAIAGLAARRPDLRLLLLSLALTQLNVLVVFGRWALLVRAIDHRITMRTAILLGFIGYVFNLVIPGAVGGDVVKAAYLARMQIRRTQAIASMILDRLLGLLGLLLLAAIAGAFAWSAADDVVRRLIVVTWVILAAALLGCTLVFSCQPIWNVAHRFCLGHPRLLKIANELHALSIAYRNRPGLIASGLALAILSHGLTVIVFFLLGQALFGSGMATTLGQHFLMVPLTLLTTAVPLPFGALGLSEEVGSQLLGMLGHPSGAIVMLALRLLMLIFALEGAAVYLASYNELRALTTGGRSRGAELCADDLSTTAGSNSG